jgi:TonB-dependent receptor
MQKSIFHKTPLAEGVALALGATMAMPAVAQEGTVEEIVVTGIRGSLMQSMDIKRQADGVVDAISAEDIGDFPDTNLAESLQRITGVSIERERGEGNRVTVRGFGPQFNLVLLNGRQMPTSGGIFGAPQGNDRSFDFSNLASEGISAVEVYKSGRADVPSGGIGSVINVKSTRPLENPGLKVSVGAAGSYDQSTTFREDTSWTGEVSGIISNTFADDKFGVSLTLVHQEREHGAATAQVNGWRSFDGANHISWGAAEGVCDNAEAPADTSAFAGQEQWGAISIPCFGWEGPSPHTNRPEPGEVYSVPQAIIYNLSDYERTRTNGQLTMQFRPIEAVTATLDYTFTEKEEKRTYNDLSAWFNFGAQTTVWPEQGDNLTPDVYQENLGGSDFSMGSGQDAYKNENESIGFNLLWDVSDALTLHLDYHDSSAETSPASEWGTNALLSLAAYTRDQTVGYFGQELPILELGLNAPLNPDQMTITGSVFDIRRSKMDLAQFTAGGNFYFEDSFVESIDFGVQLTDVENRNLESTVQRDSWSAQSPLGAISDLLTPASTAGAFDEIPGSGDSRLQQDFFLWSMPEMIARAEQLMASGDMPIFNPGNLDFGPCGTALCPSTNYTLDRAAQEETASVYLQVNMATELASRPVSMRLGLRYEQTDVDNTVFYPNYTGLRWVSGNELSYTNNGEQIFENQKNDYNYLLPNFDFRIDITDDIVGRFSASQTITRPTFQQSQGGLTIDAPYRAGGGTGFRGNPGLKPLESDNFDLSFEWYYSEGSYVSVGYFYKDVTNFVNNEITTENLFGLPDPVFGPLGVACDAFSFNFPPVYGCILDTFPDEEGVNAADGIIEGVPGRDPLAVFQVSNPINTDETTVDGWELNLQHNFGDTGFGFILNATFVDTDDNYDPNNLNDQFAIFGLSDSANFIPYWENEDWSVRVAYNWRDTFLNGTGQGAVGGNGPNFVDEYAQWDMSVSYWATDNLQFYADALNITNETTYVYGRDKNSTLFATQYGPRYTLGVRYKF